MRSSYRGLWITLGVALVLILFAAPMFGIGMWWQPGMMDRFGMRPFGAPAPWLWGFWGVGLLVRLLFWGLLIWLVVSLFRGAGRPWGPRFTAPESPEEIVRRRYASGEISREQFEEMRQHLSA